MDDEGAVSCLVDALRVFCLSFAKDTSRKLYLERPALQSSLRESIAHGEASPSDLEDVMDAGELWFAIVDTCADGVALFGKGDTDIEAKLSLLPSHVSRAVGCLCVTVEVVLERHPHLHTTITECLSDALFDAPSPPVVLALMQSYRDYIPYVYQFIKRVGGSPRVPETSWERWESDAAAAVAAGDGVSVGGDVDDTMDESLQVSVLSMGNDDDIVRLSHDMDGGRGGDVDLTMSDEGLAGLRLGAGGYYAKDNSDGDGNDKVLEGEDDGDDEGPVAMLIPLNSGYEDEEDNYDDEDSDNAGECVRPSPTRSKRSPTRMKANKSKLVKGTAAGVSARHGAHSANRSPSHSRSGMKSPTSYTNDVLRISADSDEDTSALSNGSIKSKGSDVGDDDSTGSFSRYRRGDAPISRVPVVVQNSQSARGDGSLAGNAHKHNFSGINTLDSFRGTQVEGTHSMVSSSFMAAPVSVVPDSGETVTSAALRATFLKVAGTTARPADRMDLSRELRKIGVPALADDVLALELSTVDWHFLLDLAKPIIVTEAGRVSPGGSKEVVTADEGKQGSRSSRGGVPVEANTPLGGVSPNSTLGMSRDDRSGLGLGRSRFNVTALEDAVKDMRGKGGCGSASASARGNESYVSSSVSPSQSRSRLNIGLDTSLPLGREASMASLNLGSPLSVAEGRCSPGAEQSPQGSPNSSPLHTGVNSDADADVGADSDAYEGSGTLSLDFDIQVGPPADRPPVGMKVNIVRRRSNDAESGTRTSPENIWDDSLEHNQAERDVGALTSPSSRADGRKDLPLSRKAGRPPPPKAPVSRPVYSPMGGISHGDHEKRLQRRARSSSASAVGNASGAEMTAGVVDQHLPNPSDLYAPFMRPDIGAFASAAGIIHQGFLEKKGSGIMGRWYRRFFVLQECTDGLDLAVLCQYERCVPSAWGDLPLQLKSVLYISDIEAVERSSKVKYDGTRLDIIVCSTAGSASVGGGGGGGNGSDTGSNAGSDVGSVYSDGSNAGSKYSGKRIMLRAMDAESCLVWHALLQRTRAAVKEALKSLCDE